MATFTMKVKGQVVTIRIGVDAGAWDAFQTVPTRDRDGFERGRGEFDVDGLRIFAEDLRTAKMIARRLR